jgi:hypothetical protein
MMADLRAATRDRCVVLVTHRATDRRDNDERIALLGTGLLETGLLDAGESAPVAAR